MRKSHKHKGKSQGHSSRPKATSFHRTSIGIHAVKEALKVHPTWAEELWVKEDFESSPQGREIIELASQARIPLKSVPLRKLDDVGSGNQGVALHLRKSPELDEKILGQSPSVLVALDQVSDPHNLGAVLRSAWLLKAQAVLVPQDRAVSVTPTVSKVAQGGVEHVPVVEISPLDQELKRLKDLGFWIFGMSHKATGSLFSMKLPDKVVWVLGAEGSGLRKPVEKACDELISIPQASADASFNVSVAAGLALAESYRQLFLSKASN